ncbi:MAG: SoxR reducing system RseC family protein [Prevotellaceae bacterium]|jgi:sigma-E factor negative regulatory protein RseC|nr:SoxR reducing system RseC family protein [Prevotellaceae bacterium]
MAGRNNTITHTGKVVGVSDDKITVLVPRASACSACHAKGFCTSTDSKETLMSIPNRGEIVTLNEDVTVSIQRSVGFQAVALAFILPVILVLAVIFILPSVSNVSEEFAGLVGLASLIPYFLLLRLLNNKFTKKFIFHIEKLQ